MNYFITSTEDVQTSAIELAEVKRLRVFDYLHQPATIISMLYNFDHQAADEKLGIQGRVLNLFQYYQRLPYHSDPSYDQLIFDQVLNVPSCQISGNQAKKDGKIRVQIGTFRDRLYYVDYYDRYGFLNRRDYYDCGCRSYSEYFEDRGRIVTRQYYDHDGKVKLSFHYRGGEGNVPVLTLIQLTDQNRELQFESEAELRAYFLDQLVASDPKAILISDRSDITLKAFQLMKEPAHRYQFFHSAFTLDGQTDSQLSEVYKPITKMLEEGKLTGLISSTKQEAQDASRRFQTNSSYGIPVTYLSQEQLAKATPISKRKYGHFIAVARLSKVKQLDHVINAVIALHKDFPQVDLDIYGYGDGWNKYKTTNYLKDLVKKNHADEYIHFCGYQHNLSAIYETAYAEILTSQYEGFAMALLEAQGHGCPVISYDINYGPAEIVDNHISGELLKVNDQQALYQSLRNLITTPELEAKYAQNAQNAVTKFSLEEIAKQWQGFLRKEDNR